MARLLYYSGGLGIAVMWMLLVFPTTGRAFGNGKSSMCTIASDSKFHLLFNFGIVLSMLLQIAFLIYIKHRLFGSAPLGMLIFVLGSISGIVMGLTNFQVLQHTHKIFAFIYFTFTGFGGLLLSYQINLIFEPLGQYLLVVMLVLGTGSILFSRVINKALLEYWILIWSSVWVAGFYIWYI